MENTTTLSAFSFFSLFLTILTLHPLANLPVFMPPGYAEVPDFFPLCDTTQTCPSLLIHQQTISVLCLYRTPLDPQRPPRPICCSQPEQGAEDLVQSSSKLFYLTHFSLGCQQLQETYFLHSSNNPTYLGRVTGFFLKSSCEILLPWHGHRMI